MTTFTRLGSSIWDWDPWTSLDSDATRVGLLAQKLWLALYTSSEAKRHAPGLWQGGIPSMADAARMPADEVVQALDRLLERDLVEYDQKYRVLRLCELPDPGEFPSNGKVVLSWWTRFKSVPPCPVRDAHVRTLRWIMDEGARQRGAPLTPDHESAWRGTFGTVQIPAPRRRGIRRLADSDTGTQVQPSLFGRSGSGNGIQGGQDQNSPQNDPQVVDNHASMRQHNQINNSDTVSDTISDTNRISDLGSRILASGEGGLGGEVGPRPVLTLVPAYTVDDVLREMRQGRYESNFDTTHLEALVERVQKWVAMRVPLDDFRVLAQATTVFGGVWNARRLAGCDLQTEAASARRTLAEREDKLNMLQEFKGKF